MFLGPQLLCEAKPHFFLFQQYKKQFLQRPVFGPRNGFSVPQTHHFRHTLHVPKLYS